MADYTAAANARIEELVKSGLSKDDIFTKFISGGKQIIYPTIGDDGKAHLVKETFK